MPPQYREISHKNVSTRCNILSFRRRESGMLISRFLGRSCEKRRGRSPPLLFFFESNRLPVPWTISSVDATRIRRGLALVAHIGVFTCANVYRFKKRSHHPLFLFHPDRGIDIPDHPDLFLDVGPPLWNRVYRLPFRFRSRLTDDTPQKIENGIWFRGEMRLHGMAKMFSKEMDQDAILDRSLSTWRWEIEISVVSYCSIILFYPPTFTFSFAWRWMKKGVWWKSREN